MVSTLALATPCLAQTVPSPQLPLPNFGPGGHHHNDLVDSDERANVTSASGQVVATTAPKGFEDIDATISTLFDVTFQGHKIGAFAAVYRNGQITFPDPAKIAAALGPLVDAQAVTKLLSAPLDAHQAYRCKPGEAPNVGCGLLPGGQSGVIVNPDTFGVTLFLARNYLVETISGPALLGPPTSGLSLIQGVNISTAAGGGGGMRFGGIFDTLISSGRSSLVGQTTVSDETGARVDQLYAQRIWSDRRAAAGILQDHQSILFNSYRVVGAELGSFYGTYLDAADDTATPIEVVLPRRAQVEIYRDGVLMASGQYDGGLRVLDTRSLPDGSYSVRVIARDGNQVLLDEIHAFSKMGNLAPPGKTAFRFRIGERVNDFFQTDGNGTAPQGLLPTTTGELVASAYLQRRLGKSFAATADVTSFNSRVFGEFALQMFKGAISGVAAVGLGSDNTRSGLITGSLQLQKFTFSLTARTSHSDDVTAATQIRGAPYGPFFRNEDSIFANAQLRVLGGSLGLSGGYTRAEFLPTTYTATLQYSRTLHIGGLGSTLLTAFASKSDIDRRVGISISFFKQVDRHTDAAFTGGIDDVGGDSGTGRNGVSPVAEAVLTRSGSLGTVDAVGQIGASTDADSDRVFTQLRADSSFGEVDGTVQYQGRTSDSGVSYTGNLHTGIAIGGGDVKLGLRSPAESMVIVDLRNLQTSPATGGTAASVGGASADGDQESSDVVADGGYRITVNDKPLDYLRPGQRVAVGLPALKEYHIGLVPDGAPQFDLSATQRSVTLYPGNVVTLRFDAERVVTIFGQLVDAAGRPIANARIEAGTDLAFSDDHGYFTVTGPLASELSITGRNGPACLSRPLAGLVDPHASTRALYRVGKIACGALASPGAIAAHAMLADPQTAPAIEPPASAKPTTLVLAASSAPQELPVPAFGHAVASSSGDPQFEPALPGHTHPHTYWRLEESKVRIDGRIHYVWAAVGRNGKVLQRHVSRTHDRMAALRLLTRAIEMRERTRMALSGEHGSHAPGWRHVAEAPGAEEASPAKPHDHDPVFLKVKTGS